MKISEMKTSELSEALCELAEPVGNIACDEALIEKLRQFGGNQSQLEQFGIAIRDLIPFLLKTHLEDTCRIISVLTGKSLQDVLEQPGLQTIKDATECVDRDLIDFFGSLRRTRQNE